MILLAGRFILERILRCNIKGGKMSIQITDTTAQANDAFKQYATNLVEELKSVFKQVENVRIIVKKEKNCYNVEILCHIKRRGDIESSAKGDTLKHAFDETFSKIEKQIKKIHDKTIKNKRYKHEEGTQI